MWEMLLRCEHLRWEWDGHPPQGKSKASPDLPVYDEAARNTRTGMYRLGTRHVGHRTITSSFIARPEGQTGPHDTLELDSRAWVPRL
jgi:hypothetical protein